METTIKILDEESIELIRHLMQMVKLDLNTETAEEDARRFFKLRKQLKEYESGSV